MKKVIIPGILAATVIVAGIFAAGSNIFNSVEAQSLKSVLVVNDDAHPVPIIGTATCPRDNVQHWDKIIFEVTTEIPGNAAGVNLPPLLPGRVYDIKVLDDPRTVADVTEKLVRFLIQQGYIVDPANLAVLKIIDVEYAIICTK